MLLLTYNRPNFLRNRLFELLEIEKVELVIVSMDYCTEAIKLENLSVLDEYIIRYRNKLRVIQRDQNLGIAHHLPTAVSEVLAEFSYVIVIEDDIRIGRGAISHFVSARELLDLDSDLFTIGGFGPTFWIFSRFRRNKWRESIYFSAWGWMTSKSSWADYEANLSAEVMEESLFNYRTSPALNPGQRLKWMRRFKKVQRNPHFTWDIQVQYWTFRLGKKHLLPTMRILENQGFSDSRSVNTRNCRPRWMGKEKVYQNDIKMQISSSFSARFFIYMDSHTIGGDRELKWIRKLLPRPDKRSKE